MLLAVCIAFLLPASLAAGYFLLLTLWRSRASAPLNQSGPAHFAKITVLMPAHNEEQVLAATLEQLRQADYPQECREIVVVADNCSDRTAVIAREFGVTVLERFDTTLRGKGYALKFGLAHILPRNPDAVLILDADCLVSKNLFLELSRGLQSGGEAFQTRVKSFSAGPGTAAYVALIGAEVDHQVAVGSCQLFGSVPLRGTGMLFTTELLRRIPWTALGLTEDAQYDAVLRKNGVKVKLVADEHIFSSSPHVNEDFYIQRRRWRNAIHEGGVPLWERLLYSKPIILSQLLATTCVVVAMQFFIESPWNWILFGWLMMIWLATAFVYLRAINTVGMTRANFFSLIQAPFLIARLAAITLAGYWQTAQSWQRTPRTAA
jgi:1,2-diacylglycerol 3-beta-glucosyltransferase